MGEGIGIPKFLGGIWRQDEVGQVMYIWLEDYLG